MKLRWFQKGFNYSQDGPGNRLVYHLQGCNLRCPWCSNPEGLDVLGECVTEPVSKVIGDVLSARPLFFDGGGLTLTGGECSLQMDAVKELAQGIKQGGVHFAIETNGLSLRLSELFPHLDLLMMDLKHYDPEKHMAMTGLPNQQVRINLQKALEFGVPTRLRIPLIHGFNDALKDMEGFARLLDGIKGFQLELLPYHEYGKDKWAKIGLEYKMVNAHVPKEQLKTLEGYLSGQGFDIISS